MVTFRSDGTPIAKIIFEVSSKLVGGPELTERGERERGREREREREREDVQLSTTFVCRLLSFVTSKVQITQS